MVFKYEITWIQTDLEGFRHTCFVHALVPAIIREIYQAPA